MGNNSRSEVWQDRSRSPEKGGRGRARRRGEEGERAGSPAKSVSPRRNLPSVGQLLSVSGDGIFSSPRKRMGGRSSSRSSRSPTGKGRRRPLSMADRDRQDTIDRENRILLRKILEQHHGIRRQSAIPRSGRPSAIAANRNGSIASSRFTSNQINQNKNKHKTDYENLLLLQKIQNVKPSREISSSFGRMSLRD